MLFTRCPPRADEWFARQRELTLTGLLDEALAEPEIVGWLEGPLTAARLRAEVLADADTEVFPAAGAEQQAWELHARVCLPFEVSEAHLSGPGWLRHAGRALIGLLIAGWLGSAVVALVWASVVIGPPQVLRTVGIFAAVGAGGAVLGFLMAGMEALTHGDFDKKDTLEFSGFMGLVFFSMAACCTAVGFIEIRSGVADRVKDPSGLMFPVAGILITAVAGILAAFLLIGIGPVSDADLDLPPRPAAEAERAYQDWRRELREHALLPLLRTRINNAVAARYSLILHIQGDAPGLRSRRATDYHIVTPATEQLLGLLDQMDGGSFALAGARGTGKTMLLTALRDGRHRPDNGPRDLVVLVPAPVEYASRDFVTHLYLSVCDAAESYFAPYRTGRRRRSVAAPFSPDQVVRLVRRQRDQVRYLQSRSHEVAGKLGRWGAEISGKAGTNRQAQPLTYPEIVARLHDLLSHLGVALRRLPVPGGGSAPRLISGIDELDRIGSGVSAERFLNDIKGIFDAPDCYFVVSVSEDALRAFELAGHGLRDVFDSTFDEMVRVEHLDFAGARDLLARRVVGLSEQFAGLAYCLSGGLPRQLIRVARELTRHRAGFLTDVTGALVRQQLHRMLRAGAAARPAGSGESALRLFRWYDDPPADMTGAALLAYARELGDDTGSGPAVAVYVEFLATVAGVFDGTLDAARTRHAAATFDALARVRRFLGVDDEIAAALLDTARTAWGLPPLRPQPARVFVRQR